MATYGWDDLETGEQRMMIDAHVFDRVICTEAWQHELADILIYRGFFIRGIKWGEYTLTELGRAWLAIERPAQPAAPASEPVAGDQWEYNELVDRNKELIQERKELQTELARVSAERDAARAALAEALDYMEQTSIWQVSHLDDRIALRRILRKPASEGE